MSLDAPSNSFYTVLGEINLLLANLKKTQKYGASHYARDQPQDQLTKNFYDLKTLLNDHSDFNEIDPSTFLSPFLEIIKSEETTGPVTGMALTSVDKFISYGLIKVSSETAANCVQHIADSITHARFVGTDSSSDEVVLMKILHVLRTLMLSPIGYHLTNASVCEIMQSCFQICFETRLTELLRRSAESILVDMVQLLFARLPQFKEEFKGSVKKLTMKSDGTRQKKTKKITKSKTITNLEATASNPMDNTINNSQQASQESPQPAVGNNKLEETSPSQADQLGDKLMELNDQFKERNKTNSESSSNGADAVQAGGEAKRSFVVDDTMSVGSSADMCADAKVEGETKSTNSDSESGVPESKDDTDYVNPRGVRFIQDGPNGVNVANVPYGLPCVRELLRFLISLINFKNSEIMISMGLNLLTIGLESGVDHIASYQSLLSYVKDDLCKKLFHLLSSERIVIYSNVLRVSFLLFESLRFHLKLQMEHFFIKLMDIIVSDSTKIGQEQKEMTIDFLLQLLRVPGFSTELYLNYDCSLNCTNLFEDLTKLLSKNAFSVQSLLTANSLSLSALLTIVDNIKEENAISHCVSTEKLNLLSSSRNNIFGPPSSGFSAASQSLRTIASLKSNDYKPRDSTRNIRTNRMLKQTQPDPPRLPKVEELKAVRTKKRLVIQSTDLFNASASKGIQFLKDKKIFGEDQEQFNQQLIEYLRETPLLDKKMIGEFLTKRANLPILAQFVDSFNFQKLRIDEALRMFLEAFRLPGEAPLIGTVMENFARHWRNSNILPNGEAPFANEDAAFTLAYAIIMLNVDQHNHNVKKQSVPMDIEAFKKNLTKCNGGQNFESELLEQIYNAIKEDEIVMPSEHTGLLRDNYLWKCLIRRGRTPDSIYIHAPAGAFNHEIFSIVWGQTISALSFVYDKSLEVSVIQKSIDGFRKCAQVAAFYMMSDVFDNIVISLCKFTALSSQLDNGDQLAVNFGTNNKAQLACKTVFQLTHNHGDILRDGWKNILDCIIQLYRAKLLPKVLIECEDYLKPNGRIFLIKETVPIVQKTNEQQGGLFSFFPFMSNDLSANKGPTPEDLEATKNAQACVNECHIEQLIHDTKFLRVDSLLELIKALIFLSQAGDVELHSGSLSATGGSGSGGASGSSGSGAGEGSTGTGTAGGHYLMSGDPRIDSDAAVFSLEILVKVVLQNRDRISCFWSLIRNHFYNTIINASEHSFFLERTVVGLLRISSRLLRREEFCNEVLSSLRMLLMFKKKTLIRRLSRQVSYGLHDLLRTNADNIHSTENWANIFTILQVYGAGSNTPMIISLMESTQKQHQPLSRTASLNVKANKPTDLKYYSNDNLPEACCNETLTDRGYTSDSELYQQQQYVEQDNQELIYGSSQSNLANPAKMEAASIMTNLANQYKIDLDDAGLGKHDKKSFAKCCEILNFLTRDMAYITDQNFESAIHCLRSFVEACVIGESNSRESAKKLEKTVATPKSRKQQKAAAQQQAEQQQRARSESDDDDQFIVSYETISIQLLDLLDTLHNKAASVFTQWAAEQKENNANFDSVVSNLWSRCWCPILQGIARLSCDRNGEARMHALQYLQRALLVHELQKLSAMEWEACFNKVLFPLLAKLLENIDPKNAMRMEETRMRASTLLCKVFLQHLTTLARLSTFTALWLTILDYMDKYMKSDKSDLLHDVIPESLKNMLLVMETTGLFNKEKNDIKFSQLCSITKDRIESFLPGLWEDLFKVNSNSKSQQTTPKPTAPALTDIPKEETTITSTTTTIQNKPIEGVDIQTQAAEPEGISDSEYTVISRDLENITMAGSNELEAQQQAVRTPPTLVKSSVQEVQDL